jgi:hypothetical protein
LDPFNTVHNAKTHDNLSEGSGETTQKYVRARSQAEYLEEFISKKILPRSINLVRLVKSSSVWDNNANETLKFSLI